MEKRRASLYSLDYLENYEDIGPEKMIFLDYLFEHGANPAIYGVNAFGCLLVEAAVYHINKLAGWLLQRGVNPAIYPFIDDLSDEDITLIDWVEDDVMSEEIRDIPDDDVKDLLRMLKEYS